ncbi:MAG: PLP-dependent cysteine synthase family protein [Candidatus Chromulinivorax sp.]
MLHNSLLTAIGNTPLVKVNLDIPCSLYAKLEYLNPGGSVKDRSSLYMIEQAEQLGLLKPGGTIIEASSGNQGIATAMIGAIKGYKVIITFPAKNSAEKLQTLKAYGAQVVICKPTSFLEDPESYHSTALKIAQQTPNSFMLNQYFNLANRQAHYHLLGPEIWKQTEGKITHFIAAAGSGGTVSGAGQFLKEKNPKIKVIAVDSNSSYRATQGNPQPYKLEGIGVDFHSPVLNYDVIDDFILASDDDSIAMLQYLAKHQGLLVGPSSGAVAFAAQQYCKNLEPDALAVIILGDSGRAYLTKNFYE